MASKSKVERDLRDIEMTGEERISPPPPDNRYLFLSVLLGSVVVVLALVLLIEEDPFGEEIDKGSLVLGEKTTVVEERREEPSESENVKQAEEDSAADKEEQTEERDEPKDEAEDSADSTNEEQQAGPKVHVDDIYLINEIYQALETFISPAYHVYPTKVGNVYRSREKTPSSLPIAATIGKALRRAIEYHPQFAIEEDARDSCYIYIRYVRKRDRLLVYLFFRDVYTPSKKRAKATVYYKRRKR